MDNRIDPDAGPVETEGQEAYPTYHDRPDSAGTLGGMRPTDAALPQSRKTAASPMLLGVLAFAVLLVIVIAIAAMNLASGPGDTQSPTETSIGAPLTSVEGAKGSLDSDAAANAAPPPAAPGETPSAADVPGGQPSSGAPAGQ